MNQHKEMIKEYLGYLHDNEPDDICIYKIAINSNYFIVSYYTPEFSYSGKIISLLDLIIYLFEENQNLKNELWKFSII